MANVRDPAFWKRFSTAVHLSDIESQASRPSSNVKASLKRPEMHHQDSWLERQQRKRKRRTFVCWAFWIGLCVFAAVVAGIVIWLVNSGTMDRIKDKIDAIG